MSKTEYEISMEKAQEIAEIAAEAIIEEHDIDIPESKLKSQIVGVEPPNIIQIIRDESIGQ